MLPSVILITQKTVEFLVILLSRQLYTKLFVITNQVISLVKKINRKKERIHFLFIRASNKSM